MDSTDFAIGKKRKIKKKDPRWSFKCNAPGHWYQALIDLKTRILKIWGGYSPKIFDGNWLKVNKDWLEESLNRGVVVADCYYSWGTKHLQKVKFIVPQSKHICGKKKAMKKQVIKIARL